MHATSQVFKAMSDETRLRILHLLSHRELCVCQLTEALGLGQSKISRHLANLRNAGLVSDRRDGLWIYYSLVPPLGRLQQLVFSWLNDAVEEIPNAEADLADLNELGECNDLCSSESTCDEGEVETERVCHS